MSFHNIQLSPLISYGFESGPTLSTVVQATASGHEYRIARQSQARHKYRASKSNMTAAQFAELKSFWLARRGALHGFRFKDWTDFSTASDNIGAPASTDCVIATGNGLETQYQMTKTYDAGGYNPYGRTISLPLTGTLVVAKDGVTLATNLYTFSASTGIITFATAPAQSVVITAGCYFDVPVRFASSTDDWLRTAYDAYQLLSSSSIEMIEILDEVEWPDMWYPGGSSVLTITNDLIIDPGTKVWQFNAASTYNAFLPIPDRIPGGHIFTLLGKTGMAGSVSVRDDAGNLLSPALTISANTVANVYLIRAGSTSTWLGVI